VQWEASVIYNYSAGKTILCIDDNDGVLSYHKALLERRGYEVLTAASARQGLRLAEVASVAAVVVDYHMPEMNGHEVATKIKRIRPQVPIVMVSSDRAVPEQALDAVDAFVPKDEVASRLLSVLNRVCRESPSSLPAGNRNIA
jgi:CheY-like chemotaxis protein